MCISKSIYWTSIADIIQVPQQVHLPWYPSGCSCSHAPTSLSVAHPCPHKYSWILIKHVIPLFPSCHWSICTYKLYILSKWCSPLCTLIYEDSTCAHVYISFPFTHIYEVSICTHTYMKFHLCTYMKFPFVNMYIKFPFVHIYNFYLD